MQPYRVQLTGWAVAGVNRLEVKVTDVLLNYVAGLEQAPVVPPEIAEHYGAGNRARESSVKATERDRAFRPLPPAGLLGPVRLEASK